MWVLANIGNSVASSQDPVGFMYTGQLCLTFPRNQNRHPSPLSPLTLKLLKKPPELWDEQRSHILLFHLSKLLQQRFLILLVLQTQAPSSECIRDALVKVFSQPPSLQRFGWTCESSAPGLQAGGETVLCQLCHPAGPVSELHSVWWRPCFPIHQGSRRLVYRQDPDWPKPQGQMLSREQKQ